MATITIAVAQDAADALSETQRIALERLVGALIEPGTATHDPLAAVLTAIGARAHEAGLTDDDIDAELAAYNMERRR